MTRAVSQEEARLMRKTQRLWDQLLQTEERAREIMLETERLRRAKDEAKELVSRRHPNLFRDASATDYMDDLDSLSGAAVNSHDSYLNKDLLDIRELLRRHSRDSAGRGDGGSTALEARIERLRRDVEAASDRSSQDDGAATVAWPKDCVPVPVETFKRLLADAAAAADATNKRGGRKKKTRHEPAAAPAVMPGMSSGDENPGGGGGGGGDSTSNDVADLSSQENEEDLNPKKLIGHPDRSPQPPQGALIVNAASMGRSVLGAEHPSPPHTQQHRQPLPLALPKQVQKAASSIEKEEISSRQSASGAENSAEDKAKRIANKPQPLSPVVKIATTRDEERPSHESTSKVGVESSHRKASTTTEDTTPDENFMLNSEDGNGKLYSSATSDEVRPSKPKAKSSSSSEPDMESDQRQKKPANPLLDYYAKNGPAEGAKKPPASSSALKLGASDTDETPSSGNMKKQLYDEVVSGPEASGDEEDDFWS